MQIIAVFSMKHSAIIYTRWVVRYIPSLKVYILVSKHIMFMH